MPPTDRNGWAPFGLKGGKPSLPPRLRSVKCRSLNLRLGHKSPPSGHPWHSIPRWCLACCWVCPKGPWHLSRTHPSQENPNPYSGSRGPCRNTCPCVFTLWLKQPPTLWAHFIPCCFPERSEVTWGCETALHVHRHGLKKTFMLHCVVKTITLKKEAFNDICIIILI